VEPGLLPEWFIFLLGLLSGICLSALITRWVRREQKRQEIQRRADELPALRSPHSNRTMWD
jgi:uncharacterized membrane-anchored protein YhcB (DUF1043 family)